MKTNIFILAMILLITVTSTGRGRVTTSRQVRQRWAIDDAINPPYGRLNQPRRYSNRGVSGRGYFYDRLLEKNRKLQSQNFRAKTTIQRYKNIVARLQRENKKLRVRLLRLKNGKEESKEESR